MYISLNWLKDFVEIPKSITPEELGLKLSTHTVEIEKVVNQKEKFNKIVVGKILEIKNGEFRLETEEDNGCRALTLKEKDIISGKEIPEPKKEEKTWIIRKTKAQDYELKPSVEPDF